MSENTTVARFRDKRTLTTEEWKAELELEHLGISDAEVSSSCQQLSFTHVKVSKGNLRTSKHLCSLDRAMQCT